MSLFGVLSFLFISDTDIVKQTPMVSSVSSEPEINKEEDLESFAVKETERKEIQLELTSPTDFAQQSPLKSQDSSNKQLISTENNNSKRFFFLYSWIEHQIKDSKPFDLFRSNYGINCTH